MKQNITLRRLIAFALSLVLTLSMTTAAFAAEGGEQECAGAEGCTATVHNPGCPLNIENPDQQKEDGQIQDPPPAVCSEQADCPLTEGHTASCPKHPDNVAMIAAVKDMIEKLPTEVTAENKGDVETKLAEIKAKLDAMNEACRAQVNVTKYVAAEKALESLSAPDSGNPSGDEKKDDQTAPSTEPTPEDKAAAFIASLPAAVTKDNVADVETVLSSIQAYEDILDDTQRATRDAYQASVNTVRAQMNLDRVNELMSKLPEAGTVTPESLTEEQAEAYKAQLTEIDGALLALTDEQKDTVDQSRYESLANALGSYYEIMKMAGAVAQVGDTPYLTLNEAVTAAQKSKKPVILLDDAINVTKIEPAGTGPIEINLNNHNITFQAGENYFLLKKCMLTLSGEGTVSEGLPNKAPVVIKSTLISGSATTGVIVGPKVTLEGWSGIFFDVKDGSKTCTKAKAVVNGTLISKRDASGAPGAGLYVNGQITAEKNVPKITLENAIIQSDDGGCGMYLGGYAETTITNSNISSTNTGIEIRAGKLTISDSTIIGGNGPHDSASNPNGSSCVNTALAVAQHTTKLPIEVNVLSGKFQADAAFAQANPENGDDAAIAKVSLNIQDGNFDGEVTSANKTDFVTGGTFSTDVSSYVPDGYSDTSTTTGHTVSKDTTATPDHAAEVNGQYFKELKNAIAAANGSEVKLLKAIGEDVTIPADTTVTLDLNGQTLTIPTKNGLSVTGSLTVKDSAGNGKITAADQPICVDGKNAKLTLDNGTVVSENGYGVYVLNDGSVTVNGGEIHSKYAALAGNNTTGNMNFEVTGGTLSAKEGPAVFMPGQTNLTVSGGTVNGGISLRMGNVNISGGTINATTGPIDDPAQYYNYPGNAWLPDALYVFGGTYTTSDPAGNALNLNITGGSFNCTNGKGSAVAIYDIGKNPQASAVRISGTASLATTTDASIRSAYQVLSLADIGVNTPADGCGNADNVGKVDTKISGGSFSTPVDEKYRADGFESNEIKDSSGKVIGYGVHTCAAASDLQNAKPATCKEEGYTGDTVCSVCGKVLTAGAPIPKTEHTYGSWVNHVEDCAKGGYKLQTCTVCGTEQREIIPAGSHPFSKDWSNNEIGHWHDCTVCSSKDSVKSHTFQWVSVSRAASGTKAQVCTECGYTSTTDWGKLELILGSNRSTVRPGKTISYLITVTNKTGKDMDDVVVSGDLGKNLTFTKATGDGKYDSKNGLWTISNLENGKSANLTLKVTVKSSVKDGTKLEYTAAVTNAEAYNGETYPEKSLSTQTATVKVSSAFYIIPKTGDINIGVWIAVLAVSLTALIAAVVIFIIQFRKKK